VVILAEHLDGVIALHVNMIVANLSLDDDFLTSTKWLRLIEFRHVSLLLWQ
jgi:hypothetical protein